MTTCKYYSSGGACLLAFMLWFQTLAHGYEVGTHAKMSEAATPMSNNLTGSLADVGISSLSEELTSDGLNCNDTATKTVLNWIIEGSICEDDTFTQAFARYRNHFYDPTNGQGFGGILWRDSGILSGMPAPDWAIDKGPGDGQLYSFSQGRQYFYDALTKPSNTERKANLARMFRTLGDVIHVVQDMAQPQHTRNDGHGFPKSAYEVYVDNHTGSLPYTGTPIPTFSTAREYFTNLAQFSNNNFVTVGTNFQLLGGQAVAGASYSLPAPWMSTDVPVQTLNPPASNDILALCGTSTPCVMTFYSTNKDVYNERASALSIFDQYLGDPGIFTLNSYTFNSAIPFLIPQAVSYSAGVLDYFFRGKLDVSQDPNSPGSFVIQNKGTEDMSGVFSLYFDDAQSNRRLIYTASSPLSIPANGQSGALTFTSPPAAKNIDKYTLVFKGDQGQELQTAVAAKAVTLNTACSPSSVGNLKFTNGGKRTVASVTKTNGNAYDPAAGANEMYSVEGTAPFKVAKRVINGAVSQDPTTWLYLSGSTPPSIKLATDNGAAPVSYANNRGDDKAAFTLTADTLSFNATPDFEAPTDAEGNNSYNTCVTAVDGSNETGVENVTAEVKYFYNVTRKGTYNLESIFLLTGKFYTAQQATYVEAHGFFSSAEESAADYQAYYASIGYPYNVTGSIVYDNFFPYYTPSDGRLTTYNGSPAVAIQGDIYLLYTVLALYENVKYVGGVWNGFISYQRTWRQLVGASLSGPTNTWIPSARVATILSPTGLGDFDFIPLDNADQGQIYSQSIVNNILTEKFTLITAQKIWPLKQIR
jgi:hypothetical protein